MKSTKFAFSAVLVLAITFTFSCSGDDPSPPPSGETSSNSSGENPPPSGETSSNSSGENPPPPTQSSSSNGVTIIGYCDYGPIQANGNGGCFPMATADDEANCAMWGKVVSSCGATTPSSNSVPSSSSNSTTISSSSSKPSSSSNSTTLSSSSSSGISYCDYGPLKTQEANGEVTGGCFAIGTAADKANCELPANGGKVVSSCPVTSGTFTDTRDSKTYKWVKIGTQTWMAENLRYQPTSGSGCYGNLADNCSKYGRLYTWAVAECPSGWHLPTHSEWNALISYVAAGAGKYTDVEAARRLKAKSGWNPVMGEDTNGDDDYGFAALSGGIHNGTNFNGAGSLGRWWSDLYYSDAVRPTSYHYYFSIENMSAEVKYVSMTIDTESAYSIRCVKD